ncbi:amino acid ABC transporter permease [Hwanghaeella grinnelliae]|uniref:Amino acid ABC transporter permease n=1 Tax=Hwanghaeella grinnelliae TaxID=2500179 RepID=A0A3S2Z6G1_9PROT|nr:amino acid ABC transporter permease [Hwanghaeella grinnelliae]RVU34138.1 amino acid ABC transporter permease [Hwanghaeella grinnelliae]
MIRRIPGLDTKAATDLAVLHPFDPNGSTAPDGLLVSRWMAKLPLWTPLALAALIFAWPMAALAQNFTYGDAFDTLLRWMPFLIKSGFLFNVLISFFAMLIGTLLGTALGLGQISLNPVVRWFAWAVTQTFRNSPWLVLLFIVLLAFPFEIVIGTVIIPVPDWMKAVVGLSLPVMANISEIVRGAVISVPTAQWEASESLAFSRTQTLWRIILPQCFKRMIPPWMNWYAILTMATPLCSLLGVEELLTLTRQAMEGADNHPELLVPFYSFALLIFFLYCYPIARLTIRLERRFMVKL